VIDLPMAFLHDGCPRRNLVAEWHDPAADEEPVRPDDLSAALLGLLRDPNVASKEDIVRTYDHEVRGGTVIRPTCGPHDDGPTDGAAFVPLGQWDRNRAIALGIGINARIGRRDPYLMGIAAVDEAVRNAVCMGADPDQLSLLDNFCWGRPTVPERLGSLVRAVQACADAARSYGAPFVSGKDSLSNEYEGTAIPGTLLITALGVVPDASCTVTSALRTAGSALVLIGTTNDDELGGSLLGVHQQRPGGTVPRALTNPRALHSFVHRNLRAARFRALHDVSEGGLAVAVAEMAIAGRCGVEASATTWRELFAESNGRYVAEVDLHDVITLREDGDAAGVAVQVIGAVTPTKRITFRVDDDVAIDVSLTDAVRAFKGIC
jgi:phosphoribosylformylglycinamidine synthase subunit PurSL